MPDPLAVDITIESAGPYFVNTTVESVGPQSVDVTVQNVGPQSAVIEAQNAEPRSIEITAPTSGPQAVEVTLGYPVDVRAYPTIAAMLASTRVGGGAGTEWRGGPHYYEEAAPDVSDHHLTAAGGQKLYAKEMGNGEVAFAQWNPALDGATDDAGKFQGFLNFLKATDAVGVLPAGRIALASACVYDTAGDGIVQGIRLRGAGSETTVLVNTNATGGATLAITSGSLASDIQHAGYVIGIGFEEDGSGSDSHGLTYRGCWRFLFDDLYFNGLNGSGLKCINTANDADSSAGVIIDRLRAASCAGPGWDTAGGTGGVSVHTINTPFIQNCGSAQMHIEGCGHLTVNNASLTGQGDSAPAVPCVILADGSTANRTIKFSGGEYGNNAGSIFQIDEVSGFHLTGNPRFVRRTSESQLTDGIIISDGAAGTVRGIVIDPVELQIDDATPVFTFLTIGTRLGTIARDCIVKSPVNSAFATGNTYVAYTSGAENLPVEIEALATSASFGAGQTVATQLFRSRITVATPGTITPNFLSQGAYMQYNLTGVGAYTINKPENGNFDGAQWWLTIINGASGGGARVSFGTGISADGYIDANGSATTAKFVYDRTSATWRQVGRWSVRSRIYTTAIGNVGTGEDDLMSHVLPAGSLSSASHGLRITAWGTVANNANPKTLKFYWGSLARLTTALTINQAGTWEVEIAVVRFAANTQKIVARLLQGGTTTLVDVEQASAAETASADITAKFTGAVTDGGGGVNDNDIVQAGMVVEML